MPAGRKPDGFALRVLERNREQKLADYKIKHNATPIDGGREPTGSFAQNRCQGFAEISANRSGTVEIFRVLARSSG
jgi:hypothetical protein